jgi:hypothetical protein
MHIDVLFLRSIFPTKCGRIMILQQSAVPLLDICLPILPHIRTFADAPWYLTCRIPHPKRHPMQRAENPNHIQSPHPPSSPPTTLLPRLFPRSHLPSQVSKYPYTNARAPARHQRTHCSLQSRYAWKKSEHISRSPPFRCKHRILFCAASWHGSKYSEYALLYSHQHQFPLYICHV